MYGTLLLIDCFHASFYERYKIFSTFHLLSPNKYSLHFLILLQQLSLSLN